MTTSITQTPQIYADFNAFINQIGLPASSWYVGITGNIPQRLFRDHNVTTQGDTWIWRRATNHTEARAIEIAYHEEGCKGSHGGGDHTAVFVYAYRITQLTVE